MAFTKSLPTDKFGNVYYGPKSYDDAMASVSVLFSENGGMAWNDAVNRVVAMLEKAGYEEVAQRVSEEKI